MVSGLHSTPPLAWGSKTTRLHRNATPYRTYAQRALSTDMITSHRLIAIVDRWFTSPSEKVIEIATVTFNTKLEQI
jgi:hypothetical protein